MMSYDIQHCFDPRTNNKFYIIYIFVYLPLKNGQIRNLETRQILYLSIPSTEIFVLSIKHFVKTFACLLVYLFIYFT